MIRDSAKRKLYIIDRTDVRFQALTIHMGSRFMAKFGSISHQAKHLEKPGGMRKKQHWEGSIAHR